MNRKENDLSRLPKWAKSEIECLRANVEHWKKAAGIIEGSVYDAESPIALSFGLDSHKPLPNTSVQFRIGDQEFAVRISKDNGPPRLSINAECLRGIAHSLCVLPRASNCVDLVLRRI